MALPKNNNVDYG